MSAADRLWRSAAAELQPAKSLARIDDKAKQVVSSVGLVGSVVTGFGLVAIGRLDSSTLARGLAVAAVCLALLAVLLALGSQLLRVTRGLTPGNLVEVQIWYRRQFRWAYLVIPAGLLVIVAVLLAGAAAVLVLTAGPDAPQPGVAVQLTGSGRSAAATLRVEATGLPAGQALQVQVVGVEANGTRTVLARAVVLAGATGAASSTVEVPRAGAYSTVESTVEAPHWRCTATVTPAATTPTTLTCSRT